MVQFEFPTIYPITDPTISGLSIPEQVARMAAGGATVIQIREKKTSSRSFYDGAAEAMKFARRNGIRIIINDRADIAMVLGADGVHLGQDDLPPEHARRVLGEKAIIGFSTHTLEQVREAVEMPIDYLAFGPVFPTATKENPDPIVGVDMLADVKKIAGRIPLVGIGGVDGTNLRQVLDSGADTAAMIGAVLSEPDEISTKVRRFLSI